VLRKHPHRGVRRNLFGGRAGVRDKDWFQPLRPDVVGLDDRASLVDLLVVDLLVVVLPRRDRVLRGS
jgi:hypothetical protein